MGGLELDHRELAAALGASYRRVTAALGSLDDLAYYEPTRARGFAVGDLVVHVRLDAERALVAFASPTDALPDRDFASYWSDFDARAPVRPDGFAAVRWCRAMSSAYERPSRGLRAHWADVAAAAARAAALSRPEGAVQTQGHVLRVTDFVATLALEACVHTLDLQRSVAVEPDPTAIAVSVATLDALAGVDVRALTGWDDVEYLLKGCGRTPVTAAESRALGPLSLPLLG
ncbi:MAG TPA: maleylpyruvate isomerase N-terminal domain-containing protein [Dermatophilaceae bacterium]|nr:maleylpyruvate isomerase N-terminal domain-containing protein [Dermatophilaceae bacterium]